MSDWLMKSEPGVYSIDDLKRDGETSWEGVRNYQARNFMRDLMKKGDRVIFYHSNADPSGAAGIARVSREAYPDPGAPAKEGWVMVDLSFVERFKRVVPLSELKADGRLKGMWVARRGMRLSVQPVEKAHFERVRAMGSKA